MRTTSNIHYSRTISAKTLDCRPGARDAFTALSITIECEGGSVEFTAIGLPAEYVRRLADAINSVRVDEQKDAA